MDDCKQLHSELFIIYINKLRVPHGLLSLELSPSNKACDSEGTPEVNKREFLDRYLGKGTGNRQWGESS